MANIVALLTDFGARDHYVAAMKGVILEISPRITIVDITHEIEPHNIDQGAFSLWQACQTFPKDTVFAAVVDPGVGSGRKIIAVKTARHVFVAPDNGLLKFVLAFENPRVIREVTNQVLFQRTVSSTFHGRDIFAPVAAKLARKQAFSHVGPLTLPAATRQVRLAQLRKNHIQADIFYQDRFGNLITNVPIPVLEKWRKHAKVRSFIRSKKVTGPFPHFAAVKKGAIGFVTGSTGMIEIACNQASAASKLRISVGHEFTITQTQ